MKTVIIGLVVLVVICVQSVPLPEDTRNLWERSGKFEGDMILAVGQKNGLLDKKYRWPNSVMPYEIGPEYTDSQRASIKAALTAFDDTNLKVRERTSTDTDYVLVTGKRSGCFAAVGFQGGKQEVNLAQGGCLWRRTIVHEFLHAAGFYHMQSNTNRDDYVTILWNNILEDQKHNFVKYEGNYITDFDMPYDYRSIMHYERKAFSKNGEDTIVPNDPLAQIGTYKEMSDIDKAKVDLMYPIRNNL